MKQAIIVLAVLFSSTAFAQKPNATDKRFAGLDQTFTQLLHDWHAAGFAVAVVEKDKLIYG